MAEQRDKVAEFIEVRSPEEKVNAVCAWTLRHYEGGRTVAIHAAVEADAVELDTRLWTFRQNAFIPHVRLEVAEEPLIEPAIIFGGEPGDVESDVLIMACCKGLPQWFDRFPHIYDFAVLYDESLRQASRDRFAAYKAAGYRMRLIKS